MEDFEVFSSKYANVEWEMVSRSSHWISLDRFLTSFAASFVDSSGEAGKWKISVECDTSGAQSEKKTRIKNHTHLQFIFSHFPSRLDKEGWRLKVTKTEKLIQAENGNAYMPSESRPTHIAVGNKWLTNFWWLRLVKQSISLITFARHSISPSFRPFLRCKNVVRKYLLAMFMFH